MLNDHQERIKYSFEQRLQLYKLAKKPRKQVRLKFDVIQKESLPFLNSSNIKVEDCKGFQTFVNKNNAKKIRSYCEPKLYSELRRSSSPEIKETDMNLLKIQNQLNQTRQANRRVQKLLEVNKTIKELGNISLKKYNQVVNLSVGSDFFQ